MLLRRDDFAVILLDVQMQDIDGFETAAEVIKQRQATSTIPIIFLTALSKDEEQVVRAYEVGAVDYVFKPFAPEILRAKASRSSSSCGRRRSRCSTGGAPGRAGAGGDCAGPAKSGTGRSRTRCRRSSGRPTS